MLQVARGQWHRLGVGRCGSGILMAANVSGGIAYALVASMQTQEREVKFQEDNNGQGPLCAEVIYAQPVNDKLVHTSNLFLTADKLDALVNAGAVEVYLAYRGSWAPGQLYR